MFLSEIEIVLLSGLGLSFVFQIVYYFYFLGKPVRKYNSSKKKETDPNKEILPVSVIISSKNESENLAKYLPSILEQDYPQFEVIVINEDSSEESNEILGNFESKYKYLYHTYIPVEAKNLSKKKLAITLGIKAAKYDILLFTEAYCKPVSKNWINNMVCHFDKETQIVTGYGAFPKSSGLISKLAVFDNLIFGLRYLSSTLSGFPYMGVGRNLAYKKELFFKGNGFQKYLRFQAGEDDLFVNENATKSNTKIEISPESITVMDSCNYKIWKEMKIRQISTSKYYRQWAKSIKWTDDILRLGFWGFSGTSLFFLPKLLIPSIAISTIFIRWIALGIILNKSSAVLQQKEKFYFSIPILDIIQPFYNLYFRIYHLSQKKFDYTSRI